jgi:hypothetical protein
MISDVKQDSQEGSFFLNTSSDNKSIKVSIKIGELNDNNQIGMIKPLHMKQEKAKN